MFSIFLLYTYVQNNLYIDFSLIQLWRSYKMSKKYIPIILILIVGGINASEGQAEQKLSIEYLQHSTSSHYLPEGSVEADITIRDIAHSTVSVHIPTSVKKINLSGGRMRHSTIIFYTEHTPQISKEKFSDNQHSAIKVMHPLRQYTYHAIAAALCALGLYLYSQDK